MLVRHIAVRLGMTGNKAAFFKGVKRGNGTLPHLLHHRIRL